MNRLEELAGELTKAVRSDLAFPGHKVAIQEAAAILLAASKVDVAGLTEKAWSMAYHAHSGDGDSDDARFAEEEFETALRMALAQRGWVGLTDDENIEVLDAVDWYNFPEDLIAETSRRLKEKNA